MNIETTILKNLLSNEEYSRKVLPFLKDEFFNVDEQRELFSRIKSYIIKYNYLPSPDAMELEFDKDSPLKEDQVKAAIALLEEFKKPTLPENLQWLLDQTEEFCQDKSIYIALMKSIEIANKKNESLSKGAIPQLLSDAIGVSFDPNVGHDYLNEFDERYEYYHRIESKIPFDLDFFNKITKDGVSKKTLNIILAGTGVGKSLALCHFAASALNQGKKVLYITLELAEEEVAKRIDANLMNIAFDDLMALSKEMYLKRAETLKHKASGKLIIKEYPTAAASTMHFKALLNELQLKKSFVPDIIFVDYLNICASARLKPGANVNSYTYVKAIAEELRGMGVEWNVPIWSATQTTRSGYDNSDPGLTDTSESFGLPATADFMFALIVTKDLMDLGQIQVKQLKNRYNDMMINTKFVIGIDRTKMKLYDVEISAQRDISDSGQTFTPKSGGSKFNKLKVDVPF